MIIFTLDIGSPDPDLNPPLSEELPPSISISKIFIWPSFTDNIYNAKNILLLLGFYIFINT